MSDCRFGVSPVNYPDPDPDFLSPHYSLISNCFAYYSLISIKNGHYSLISKPHPDPHSYSVCRDVNTHTGTERCVMYRSSFRTFPSFLNPREYSAHNTWTTLWSFRSFSSKPQSSFILSTITEQWKFSYRIFTYVKKEISFLNLKFQCPLTIQKSVSQKSQNSLFFYQKDLTQKIESV